MIHSGGIMKDNNATIAAYGIKEGSTVTVIGSGEIPPSKPPAVWEELPRINEHNMIASVRTELDRVQVSLRPALTVFSESLKSRLSKAKTDLEYEHKRIGELLLQSLLRLDALAPESHWSDARSERKNAVQAIQAMLDELDGGWKDANDM